MISGIVAGRSYWTPALLPTPPSIWLDDQSAVTNVSGLASQINDRSGNGAHFSQSNASYRPQIVASGLNGRRILRFDGADDRMENQSSRALYQNVSSGMMMVVYTKRGLDGAPTFRSVFAANTGGDGTRLGVGAGFGTTGNANKPYVGARRLDADAAAVVVTPTARADTVMMISLVNYAAGSGDVYIDGSLGASNPALTTTGSTSNTAPGTSSPLQVGASVSGPTSIWAAFADIDLAAALAWRNYVPVSGDIDRLFGWAAWRYGLQANLPPGHPYKNSPP